MDYDTIRGIVERFAVQKVANARSARVNHVTTDFFAGTWVYRVDTIVSIGMGQRGVFSRGARMDVLLTKDGRVLDVQGQWFLDEERGHQLLRPRSAARRDRKRR